MTEVIEYQEHLNSQSEIVGLTGFVGLSSNIYQNVKQGKKSNFMLLKMVILVKRENFIKASQSYEYIVSLIFKDKIQVPTTLLLF